MPVSLFVLMNSSFPVIRRELAALARRRSEFPVRTAGLLMLLLVLGLAWSNLIRYGGGAFTSQQLARVGRGLLVAFHVTLTSVLLLAVPAAMAGALAGEREEKSLDLLRMTPLGAFQIVLAKFLARLGSVLLWVVLAAPFVLVPLFFGGVTPADAWLAVLYPVGAAVWAASASLLASAYAARALTAALATFIGAGAWHALVAILLVGAFDLEEHSLHALPVVAYFIVPVEWMENGGRQLGSFLWVIPLETLAFALASVWIASRRLRRESEARGEMEARAARRAGPRPAAPGRPADPAGRRRVWGHAVAWKEIAAETGSGTRRLLGLGLILYVGGFLLAVAMELDDVSALVSGAAGGLVILAGIAGALRKRWRRPCWSVALFVAAMAGAMAIRCAAEFELFGSTRMMINPSIERDKLVIPLFMKGLSAYVAAAGVVIAMLRKSWLPSLVAAAAVFLLLVSVTRPDRIEDDYFYGGSAILALYLGAMAPLLAANAVGGERKRGTLEGLLMTPLTAAQIVSGKALGIWAALAPGLGLLVLHLAVLAGLYRPEAAGVAMAFAVFAVWLAMTIEFGLFVSTAIRKAVHAVLVVMGSLLLYVAGLPLFVVLAAGGGSDTEAILYVNPAFWFIGSLEYRGDQQYWPGPIDSAAGFITGLVVFTTVCLGAAVLFRLLARGSVRESSTFHVSGRLPGS